MADLSVITREHILEAVEIIRLEERPLNASLRYDVIIEGDPYPPKEVVRLSYFIATGDELTSLYGGEQANSVLEKNGFEIRVKNAIWKLGCRWGSGMPSFSDLLLDEAIVIGTTDMRYHINDLVLISDGFLVFALAKLTSAMKPVTETERLKSSFQRYAIPYEANILVAKAEIYVLPKRETFIYQLQQGIRRVRAHAVVTRALNIWENREQSVSTEEFRFYKKEYHQKPGANWKFPCLVLEPNSWDDYSYQTSHDLFLYKNANIRVEIGLVKILDGRSNLTSIPNSFFELPAEMCSLGQTLEYYSNLKSQFPDAFPIVLRRLRDVAFDSHLADSYVSLPGFQLSLIRSSEAQLIFSDFEYVNNSENQPKQHQFSFAYRVGGALESHVVDFSFNSDPILKNHFFCLVGKNATGKTKFIAQLANKLADAHEMGDFKPERPSFSKIIVASFSYFDKFRFPKREDTNYEFIGIKSSDGRLLRNEETTELIWRAFCELIKDSHKRELWKKSMEGALETEFFSFKIDDLFETNKQKFSELTQDIFSSGQSIIFQFLTRYIYALEKDSILVFDEPETHLHPNIAGRLLRTVDEILKEFSSVSILATHSPIIVQEIPSKYIRIFKRHNNFPVISQPTIECFGENLTTISNYIFSADKNEEIYRSTLERLASKLTIEQINNMFSNNLSLNARIFLQSLKSAND